MAQSIAWALTAALPLFVPPAAWARARVSLAYAWRHGRVADIDNPQLFTEWVQWRKLHDRDHGLAMLTDKLFAKAMAADRIGPEHVIPTLWSGHALPRRAPWPMPFIVKANHGCNQFVVVRKASDWQAALRLAPAWLREPYGRWLDEWHYTRARRMILVEPHIGEAERLPLDYKVYVFNGVARCIQVHLDRMDNHRWVQFDRHWQQMSSSRCGAEVRRPETLAQMLRAAEAIASTRDHLRVDFYEVDGIMYFGETCLFPGSGLDPFHPQSLDEVLGRFWGSARH